jgi:subtilisin family serine protease
MKRFIGTGFAAALLAIGLGSTGVAATAASLQPLAGTAGIQRIANQYIVTLGKLPADSALAALDTGGLAQLLAAQYGGQILHVYEHALRGFAIRMPDAAAALLAQHPAVAAIEPDQVMRVIATQTGATWGIDRVDQRDLPLNGQYVYPEQGGQGVHVYIIDTGLNASHVDFTGRVSTGRNFVGGLVAPIRTLGTTARGTARTWPARPSAPSMAWPRRPSSTPCAYSTARAAARTPMSSPAWTGSRPITSSLRWRTCRWAAAIRRRWTPRSRTPSPPA